MRGLDIYDKYLVIGFSNNIKSNLDKNYCAIHLFDTEEKSIVNYFNIDDNYVITDLKIIH
jgi:hypothetical protein